MADEAQPANQGDNNGKVIIPEKVYLKDVSFETPGSPDTFTLDWQPKLSIDWNSKATDLGDDTYEVVLTITAIARLGKATAFLAEVHQAGIFTIKGFDTERLDRVHNIYCLRLLFPYASHTVSDLVSRGGFPPPVLRPISFESVHEKHRQQAQADAEGSA